MWTVAYFIEKLYFIFIFIAVKYQIFVIDVVDIEGNCFNAMLIKKKC